MVWSWVAIGLQSRPPVATALAVENDLRFPVMFINTVNGTGEAPTASINGSCSSKEHETNTTPAPCEASCPHDGMTRRVGSQLVGPAVQVPSARPSME